MPGVGICCGIGFPPARHYWAVMSWGSTEGWNVQNSREGCVQGKMWAILPPIRQFCNKKRNLLGLNQDGRCRNHFLTSSLVNAVWPVFSLDKAGTD